MRGRKPTLIPGVKRGVLTIVERLPNDRFRAECDCGKTKEVGSTTLSLAADHCTCDGRGRGGPVKYKPGMTFGKLAIVKRLPDGQALCQCECGNQTVVRVGNLHEKGGVRNTSSCGCDQFSGVGREREYLNGQVFGDFRVVRYESEEVERHVGRCVKCGHEAHFCPSGLRALPTCPACDGAPIGKRFGNWTVLCHEKEARGHSKGRSGHWWCRCDCGLEKAIWRSNLERGVSMSCRRCSGVSRREKSRVQRLKKYVERKTRGVS